MLNLFKKKLPHCDILFKKYLAPWYPADNRPLQTRPDLYTIAAFQGDPIDLDTIQYLTPVYLNDYKNLINSTMLEAALADFQGTHIDLVFLEKVDSYFNKAKILELLADSDPTDFGNSYIVTVCELGALLGALFKQNNEFDWLYSNPYFHSIIVHKNTGIAIPVFDWAVKKLSGYGVDDGLVQKFQAANASINQQQAKRA